MPRPLSVRRIADLLPFLFLHATGMAQPLPAEPLNAPNGALHLRLGLDPARAGQVAQGVPPLHGHLPRVLPAIEDVHDAHLILVHTVNDLVVASYHAAMPQPFVLQPRFHLATKGELFKQVRYGKDILHDAVGHLG